VGRGLADSQSARATVHHASSPGKKARAPVNTRVLYHKATPYKIISTGQKASAASLLPFGTSLYGNIRGGNVQGGTGYQNDTSADLTAKATPRVPREIPWVGTPRTSYPSHCPTLYLLTLINRKDWEFRRVHIQHHWFSGNFLGRLRKFSGTLVLTQHWHGWSLLKIIAYWFVVKASNLT
jgi:hypothetical protein